MATSLIQSWCVPVTVSVPRQWTPVGRRLCVFLSRYKPSSKFLYVMPICANIIIIIIVTWPARTATRVAGQDGHTRGRPGRPHTWPARTATHVAVWLPVLSCHCAMQVHTFIIHRWHAVALDRRQTSTSHDDQQLLAVPHSMAVKNVLLSPV